MILQALSALGGGIIDKALAGGAGGGGGAPAGPVTTGDFKFGEVTVTGKKDGVNPWVILAGVGVVGLLGVLALNILKGKR